MFAAAGLEISITGHPASFIYQMVFVMLSGVADSPVPPARFWHILPVRGWIALMTYLPSASTAAPTSDSSNFPLSVL